MGIEKTNIKYIWYGNKAMMYTYEDCTENFCEQFLTEAEAIVALEKYET